MIGISNAGIFAQITVERNRQDEKWGFQRLTPDRWNTILMEEIGEVSQAINDEDWDNLETELIQSAAVIVAWLTDRRLDRVGF